MLIYYMNWALAALLYAPIFFQLYQSRWENIDYTHAYFILPFSLWVVWRSREALKRILLDTLPGHSDMMGLGALALGLLMFIFGWRLEYLFIATLSVIPVLWGLARHMHGAAFARALTFPILYLLFLVPPPLGILDAVTMPLRYGISTATERILSACGYPIAQSGLMLTMGGHDLFMGEPCSGLRSLITMFALAVAYMYFSKSSPAQKVVLVAAVLPLALFGNLLRVITLCLITFYFGPKTASGFMHYFSGGIIFLIMIGGLMGLEHLMESSKQTRGKPL